MNDNRRSQWFLAAALLIACAAAWPLMREAGLLNTRGGGDSPFLLQRLHQLETAVRDGHFPVRWMPDANYGYGYPFFNFYAPFAFYVAVLFRFLGFSIVRSIQISQLLAFLVAAGGMFKLGRRWFKDEWMALLASVAYTVAPFHLVNVYVRGDSIAEFWAMAFYPLVMLAISQWPQTIRKWADVVRPSLAIALAYAGLIISHNISAMIFSPFILLYALIKLTQTLKTNRASAALYTSYFILPLFLALALSAWFWLPALGEQSLTQLDSITADYFNYNNHFRTTDLTQTTFFFDFDTSQLQAFRMGLVQTVLILLGIGSLLYRWLSQKTPPSSLIPHPFLLLFSLLLATVMITPLTKPLWDYLPLLPFTQFPWRFLSIQAFWGALTAACLLTAVTGRWRPWVSGGVILLLLVSSLGQLPTDYLYLTDGDITAERLAQYEWFTGNIGTTISAEYLAQTMQPRPYTSPWLNAGERWQANVTAGSATAEPVVSRTQHQYWRVAVTSEQATLVLPTMYWAGWTAADGRGNPLPLQPAVGSGLMEITVPQGEQTVHLQLRRTPIRATAEWVSLAAVLLCVGLAAVSGVFTAGHFSLVLERRRLLALMMAVAAVVVLPFLNNLVSRPFSASTLTWDFGEMGYLHHAPQGIPYGNGAHLASYNVAADTVMAGQMVDITLDWAAQPAGDIREVTIVLTNPANNFYNFVPPLAADTQPLQIGPQQYQLQIPANAPAGLYFPLVTLSDNNRPRTQDGKLRAALSLSPVRVLSAQTADFETEQQLDIRPLQITQRTPNVLDLQLAWYTAAPRPENLKMSLRLTNAGGAEIFEVQFDNQPGYGYRPSVGWAAGQWTNDWLALYLPDELPFPPPYKLVVQLYEQTTNQRVLTRRLGELTLNEQGELVFQENLPVMTLPEGLTSADVVYKNQAGQPIIALRGYTYAREGDVIDLTLYWEALAAGAADYTHFAHLLDPQTGQPVVQHDAMPQHNTYPTSQWTTGEIVADPLQLSLENLPSGSFDLSVGLYEVISENEYPRLQATTAAGEPLPNDALTLLVIEP